MTTQAAPINDTVQPKQSAAGVILSNEPTPRVLMIRRHEKLRFMGGHHAFPGGRIDDHDSSHRVVNAPSEDEARAIHALAREIFEETGMLAVRGALPARDEIQKSRRALLAEAESFDAILDRFGLTIDASEFIPAGLWITPKGSPIRFHSRYYLHLFRGEPHHELIEGEVDRVEWMEPTLTRQLWRQGELLLPPPVAYVLQQLAAFSYPEVMEPLRRTTHVVPETPGRIEYRCGINVLPLRAPALPPSDQTNCVVVGEKELYVIDPATPYEEEQFNLAHQLDHILELGGRIAASLLTHSHPDHVGAAEFVRKRYGAPIWAHAITADRVNFKLDRHLGHDEVIEIAGDPDWRLRAIHTPGHDPGHLCFLEETTNTLIGGDMIAEKGTIIVPADMGGDMTAYLASLDLMLTLNADLLIPAHGFPIPKPEAKIRQYIAHRNMREAKIKSVLDRGITNFKEILEASYDDVDPRAWPLAEKSLMAHLIRLGYKGE